MQLIGKCHTEKETLTNPHVYVKGLHFVDPEPDCRLISETQKVITMKTVPLLKTVRRALPVQTKGSSTVAFLCSEFSFDLKCVTEWDFENTESPSFRQNIRRDCKIRPVAHLARGERSLSPYQRENRVKDKMLKGALQTYK